MFGTIHFCVAIILFLICLFLHADKFVLHFFNDQIRLIIIIDTIIDTKNIEWAVKRLLNNRTGGGSQMRAEHLNGWLAAARRGQKGETTDKDGGGQENTREGAENWARFM